jgi:hypothetical protein
VEGTFLQHDDAPAQCTNVDLEYLDETLGNRWIGHAKPVYKNPVETQHDLVAKIAVAAGTTREMPGIFQRVQYNIARRYRTFNEVGSLHFEQLL